MVDLSCLGSIELSSSEHGPATRVLAQAKRFALLAYLTAARPPAFHRRDSLIALFWPEADDKRARTALRISLSFLRRELGDDVIVTRGDDVSTNRHVVRCDVDEFETAINAGDLERGLLFYRGDLLPGFHVSAAPDFERWVDTERARLKQVAQRAALDLSARHQASGNLVHAVRWLRFAADLAPDDEAVVQRLIRLFDRTGDRAAALRTYDSFAARMAAEFESEPAPETRGLIAQIRTRATAAAAPSHPDADDDRREPTPAALPRPTIGSRRGPRLLTIYLCALLAILGTAAFLWPRQPSRRGLRARVTVVALQNQTGRQDLDYIGAMAAHEIAHDVGEAAVGDVITLPGLPSREMTELGSPDLIQGIAKKTRARIVITGGYTIERDSLLLRVDVADAEKERLLATVGPLPTSLTRPSDGIRTVASQVLSAVARVVDGRLSLYMEQKGWSRPTPIEGFRATAEGFELFLAGESEADYEKAIDRFAYAYALDSNEINSRFEMAIIEQGLDQWARAETLLTQTEAIRKRMTPEEQGFLDFLRARSRGDHVAAYQFARVEVERKPHVVWEFATGYHALAAGRPHEAARMLDGLDPDTGFFKGVWAYRGVMAETQHVLGDHLRELELARLQREKQPQFLSTALYETRARAALGQVAELRAILDESDGLGAQSGLAPLIPRLRGLSTGSLMLEAAAELRAHGHGMASAELLRSAEAWYRARLKSDPNSEVIRRGLGETLYLAERWDDAGDVMRELARENPDDVDYRGYTGVLAARQGRRDDASASSDILRNANGSYQFGRATIWRARIAAQLADSNAAISLLRQSLTEGHPFGLWLHRDIDFEPLRDTPAFRRIVHPDG